jgi:hypothetical protein
MLRSGIASGRFSEHSAAVARRIAAICWGVADLFEVKSGNFRRRGRIAAERRQARLKLCKTSDGTVSRGFVISMPCSPKNAYKWPAQVGNSAQPRMGAALYAQWANALALRRPRLACSRTSIRRIIDRNANTLAAFSGGIHDRGGKPRRDECLPGTLLPDTLLPDTPLAGIPLRNMPRRDRRRRSRPLDSQCWGDSHRRDPGESPGRILPQRV